MPAVVECVEVFSTILNFLNILNCSRWTKKNVETDRMISLRIKKSSRKIIKIA
jgi:hypothetical protein